jgi:hypothetical protein
MQEILTMSTKERQRLQMIGLLKQGKITVAKAAAALGMGERQMYRVLLRYHQQGDRGLLHQSRGKASNRGYPRTVRVEAVRLYQKAYPDYGPTLFAEMLAQHHDLVIDSDTLRRWLKDAALWTGMRAARKHRQRRERREAIGALVQFDGSTHEWFEDRGRGCCLLVAIDDASGRVFMRFATSENGQEVLAMLKQYVQRFGIPREFYVDFGSVYYAKRHRLTDVARALSSLGVGIIYARSPQAKGRVERSNRTHQDRLIKALRRHQISTIEEANTYLDTTYLAEHNCHFARQDHLSDVHRSAEGLELDNIFCFESRRCVNHDYTITVDARIIQLIPASVPLPPPRQKVTVRRWLDGSLHIFWHDHELAFRALRARPAPRPRTYLPAPHSHPWRDKALGDKHKRARHYFKHP